MFPTQISNKDTTSATSSLLLQYGILDKLVTFKVYSLHRNRKSDFYDSLSFNLADLNWPEEQSISFRDLGFPVDGQPICNNIFLFGW